MLITSLVLSNNETYFVLVLFDF